MPRSCYEYPHTILACILDAASLGYALPEGKQILQPRETHDQVGSVIRFGIQCTSNPPTYSRRGSPSILRAEKLLKQLPSGVGLFLSGLSLDGSASEWPMPTKKLVYRRLSSTTPTFCQGFPPCESPTYHRNSRIQHPQPLQWVRSRWCAV